MADEAKLDSPIHSTLEHWLCDVVGRCCGEELGPPC